MPKDNKKSAKDRVLQFLRDKLLPAPNSAETGAAKKLRDAIKGPKIGRDGQIIPTPTPTPVPKKPKDKKA